MNGLTLLVILTGLAVAWTIRAYALDASRQRRRADRLAREVRDLRTERERLLDELDMSVDALMRQSRDRHPSNVRVLKRVK